MIAILSAILVAFVAFGAWLWTPDKSKAELEATYFRPQSSYVDVAGIKLHVRDSGPQDAPVVIMLHGMGSSLHTWQPWAEALSNTHRVIRFDLPGFGLTGADPTGDYSDKRGLEVLSALMDRLSGQRASLVGNSMGGRLAWLFAAAHPERVDKLVLIAPDGFESPGFEYGKAPAVPALLRMMKYVLPKAMLRMNLEPAYADPGLLTHATLDRYYDLMLAPGVREAMLDRMEQTVLSPPEPALKRIAAPTLLLWGEADAMIPASNAQDYLKSMSSASLVTLASVGHVPQEEAPTTSLQALRTFLDNR